PTGGSPTAGCRGRSLASARGPVTPRTFPRAWRRGGRRQGSSPTGGSPTAGCRGGALPPPVGAPASAYGQRGAGPLQACALRPVTEGNCVTVRWGGKQPEVSDQSVG